MTGRHMTGQLRALLAEKDEIIAGLRARVAGLGARAAPWPSPSAKLRT